MEALPALLGGAVVHVLRDANPVVGALLANQLEEQLVLFRDPRSTTVSGGHGGLRFLFVIFVCDFWLSGYWVLERTQEVCVARSGVGKGEDVGKQEGGL